MTEIELSAVSTAAPIPYVHDVVSACRASGRSVALVSTISVRVVRSYLTTHNFSEQSSVIAARTGPGSATREISSRLIEHKPPPTLGPHHPPALVGNEPGICIPLA
jgi:hypothetical protein